MSAETPQEFGEELRRERELREVSREQLAEVTKVSVRQIEALEGGRFELLPARVFSRGFVRAIAKHLGLDPELSAAAFSHVWEEWSQEQAGKSSTVAVAGPVRLSRPRRRTALDTTALGVGIAVVLASAAGVFAIVKARGGEKPATLRRAAMATPDPASGPAALSLPPTIAEASVALPPGSSLSPSPASVAPAASRPAPSGAGRTLTLTFQEDCWIEVSIDGKVAAAELGRAGTVREFSGAQRFVLTLGNAGGVVVKLDGTQIRSLGSPGEVVRDVVVDGSLLGQPQGG